MKPRRRNIVFVVLIGLTMTFFFGPKPRYPEYNPAIAPLDIPVGQIESYISERENKVELLKPGNASFFQWANGRPEQTEYAVIFLHGFSASPMAGSPVITGFAKRYGCNLYVPRIAGHGLDTEESFAELSPADMINSAKEALAVGQIIGKKTILVGSSTGCTLAAYLAAYNPDYAHSLLFFSPNIDLADKASRMLLWPWGKQIVRLVVGKYRSLDKLIGTQADKYWTTKYRTEGLIALKFLLSETMTEEVFQKINQPLYLSYYYQDEEHKDEVVSIPALQDFYGKVSTPSQLKRMDTIPTAGAHVMLSDIQCKDVAAVSRGLESYVEEVLEMKPLSRDRSPLQVDSVGEGPAVN